MSWDEYKTWRENYLADVHEKRMDMEHELSIKALDERCKCDVDCSASMGCPGVANCPNQQGEDDE